MLLATVCSAALAVNATTTVTVVNRSDNSEVTHSVTESGLMYFSGDNLVIKTDAASAESTYALSSVRKVLFAQGTTSHVMQTVAEGTIALYPNPATDVLYIVNAPENAQADIYTIAGVLVKSQKVGANEPINISSLSAGIYLVRINNTVLKFSKK